MEFKRMTCIKVNESQLDNDTSDWSKDANSTWSLECD